MELLFGGLVILFGVVMILSLYHKKNHHSSDTDDHVGVNAYDILCDKFSEVIAKVKPYYNLPGRHYHNWAHIDEGLRFIADNRQQLVGDDVAAQSKYTRLVLAWLFHDAVYNITATNNEHRSGMLALDVLSLNFSHFDFIGIDKIIEATAHTTNKRHTCSVADMLCDVDLIRLGADWDTFLMYSDQVYQEYKSLISDRQQFMAARATFFSNMISDSAPIYKTIIIRDKYEQQARSNIARFISEFGTGS